MKDPALDYRHVVTHYRNRRKWMLIAALLAFSGACLVGFYWLAAR